MLDAIPSVASRKIWIMLQFGELLGLLPEVGDLLFFLSLRDAFV